MMEAGALSDIGAVAALVAISFVSFVIGIVFRKWPEKVQEFTENIDGFGLFITPDEHRSMIQVCGVALILMSFGALGATIAV